MKSKLRRVSGLVGVLFIATSCYGFGQGDPLPTPVATATQDVVEEATDSVIEQTESIEAENEEVSEQSSASPTRFPAEKYADLEIVTLLPRDAIPAIDNPQFLSATEADEFYDENELVMGVSFDGEARAYSVPFLSNHEIVNDTISGRKIAVTW